MTDLHVEPARPYPTVALGLLLGALLLGSSRAGGANFADSSRWSTTALSGGGLQQGDPTLILWSVAPDGTNITHQGGNPSTLIDDFDTAYNVPAENRTADLTNRTWWGIFNEFFTRTTEITGVTFIYEPNDDGANWAGANGVQGVRGDVRIGGFQGDPFFTALNYFPGGGIGGNMVINSGWSALYNTGGLRNVTAHEHLHGLGLNHVDVPSINVQMEAGGRTQFDDLYALQRLYGDALEKGAGNDTLVTATPLGSLGTTGVAARGVHISGESLNFNQSDYIGIDGTSDTDWFRFTVDASVAANLTVTPKGPTYSFTPEGGSEQTLAANEQSDLAIEVFDAAGRRLVRQNIGGLGEAESLSAFRLREAGDYYLRVYGAQNKQQFYRADVAALPVSEAVQPSLVFLDNFSAADSADENLGRTTLRQFSGLLDSPLDEGSTDAADTSVSIQDGRLRLSSVGDGSGANQGFADFTRNFGTELAGRRWSASFDLELAAGSGVNDGWLALTLNDELPISGPFAESAELSMLVRDDGRFTIRENGGTGSGEANVNGNSGAVASRIELIVDETGIAPRMTVLINGIAQLSDEAFAFSSDERFFSLRTHVGGAAADNGRDFFALVDNFTIRLLAPVAPAGDYNGDGFVDAADYTQWRDSLGAMPALAGNGADGDVNGVIDSLDYAVWKLNFGASGVAIAPQPVPEPTAIRIAVLTAFALSLLLTRGGKPLGR